MKTTLQSLTAKLNMMDLEYKAQAQEADAMRAVTAESRGEAMRVREELISEHAREVSYMFPSFLLCSFFLFSFLFSSCFALSLSLFFFLTQIKFSALRIKTASEIADRDRKLIELTEKVGAHEREFSIERERLQGEIETKILLKYENAQREFEQKLMQEINNSKSMQGDLLKKREEHVQKLELGIAEKVSLIYKYLKNYLFTFILHNKNKLLNNLNS